MKPFKWRLYVLPLLNKKLLAVVGHPFVAELFIVLHNGELLTKLSLDGWLLNENTVDLYWLSNWFELDIKGEANEFKEFEDVVIGVFDILFIDWL